MDSWLISNPRPKDVTNYLTFSRLAFTSNGDRIKYDEKGEIERVFSPGYGWNNMPGDVRETIARYNLK
jgi:hypothetical protein